MASSPVLRPTTTYGRRMFFRVEFLLRWLFAIVTDGPFPFRMDEIRVDPNPAMGRIESSYQAHD